MEETLSELFANMISDTVRVNTVTQGIVEGVVANATSDLVVIQPPERSCGTFHRSGVKVETFRTPAPYFVSLTHVVWVQSTATTKREV